MEYLLKRKEEKQRKLNENNKNKENIKEEMKVNNLVKNCIKEIMKKHKRIFCYVEYKYLNDRYLLNILYKFKRYFSSFILLFILLINFSHFTVESYQTNDLLKSFEITLKINGSGNIKILSDIFFNKNNQCEIYK